MKNIIELINRIFSVSIIVVCMISIVWGKPTTRVAIFNHSGGARQLGMADVSVALADDANALFVNPAGIATIRRLELHSMYVDNIVDTQDAIINAVYPLQQGLLGKQASIGIGIKAYQGGDIEVNLLNPDESLLSSKTLDAENDYMVGVGYSEEVLNIYGTTYLGLVVKGIQSTLVEQYRARAVAVDVGVLYKAPVEGLSLGLSILNNGSELKFVKSGDKLPMRVVGGLGYHFEPVKNAEVKIGLDTIKERGKDSTTNIGFELMLRNMIAVRSGYYINSDLGSVTVGLGIRLDWLQVDYGYGMMDELGNVQRVSMTMRWDTGNTDRGADR